MSRGRSRLTPIMASTRHSTSVLGTAVLALTLSSTMLIACSDADRSASRFCGELATELPLLGGPFVDGGDIDDLVSRYERLDRITPLAIDDEWSALTGLIRLAADVDVDDPASRQELADTAYKTERSARDVAIWVETTCGLSMPDVVGVEGSVPVNVPTTTTGIPEIPAITNP